jgi:hypothetical protein
MASEAELALLLKQLMTLTGLSEEQVAAAAGVHKSQLRQWLDSAPAAPLAETLPPTVSSPPLPRDGAAAAAGGALVWADGYARCERNTLRLHNPKCTESSSTSHARNPFNLTFFYSAQCLMVRRWRLIGYFPILTFLIRLSV